MVSSSKLLKSIFVMVSLLLLPIVRATDTDIELSDVCSLADAITAANTDDTVGGCPAGDGADTILFAVDIRLRAELPEISSSIVIEGEGYRISGATEHRIFYVGADGELSINNLHLLNSRADDCRWINRDGNVEVDADSSCGGAILNLGVIFLSNSSIRENSADEKGGGIYNSRTGELHIAGSHFVGNVADYGGAIYNMGKVSIAESDFSDNTAYFGGGATYNVGHINVTDSRFSSNSSGYSIGYGGGAIYNLKGGEISIVRSLFQGNSSRRGGAIYNERGNRISIADSRFSLNLANDWGGAIRNISGSELQIRRSSFIGNRAEDHGGGAISNGDQAEIIIMNSTFSGNEADEGGGISISGGEATLTHLTIAHNTAESGGGLFVDDEDRARVRLRNSIITANHGRDCFGTIGANDTNLDTSGTCNAVINDDPMLGELTKPEDGSPAYFPLLEGSPAIDAADSLFCPDTDIIGTPRPQGESCDIGAIEYTGTDSD